MKKGVLYAAVIAAAMLVPVKRANVGQLLPVELVMLRTEGKLVVLETDTGNIGKGTTVESAYCELEQTAPGNIYLDTARYLMVSEAAQQYVIQISKYLKDNVRVCYAEQRIDLKDAAEYLRMHKPKRKLEEVLQSGINSVLCKKDKGLELKYFENIS